MKGTYKTKNIEDTIFLNALKVPIPYRSFAYPEKIQTYTLDVINTILKKEVNESIPIKLNKIASGPEKI